MKYELDNVNMNKLHNEFIESGLFPYPVMQSKDGKVTFVFEEGVDVEKVQNIIDTHDPTPLPKTLSEIDKLKIIQAEQFETILTLLGGL